jgi:hypothetical protein
MPPTGSSTAFTPEGLQPLVVQRHDVAIGLHHLSGLGAPEPSNHKLAHFGEVEVMLGGNAEKPLLGVERAEQLTAA